MEKQEIKEKHRQLALFEEVNENLFILINSLAEYYIPFLEQKRFKIINDKIYVPAKNIKKNVIDENKFFIYDVNFNLFEEINNNEFILINNLSKYYCPFLESQNIKIIDDKIYVPAKNIKKDSIDDNKYFIYETDIDKKKKDDDDIENEEDSENEDDIENEEDIENQDDIENQEDIENEEDIVNKNLKSKLKFRILIYISFISLLFLFYYINQKDFKKFFSVI